MSKTSPFSAVLIAPCGIDCRLCRAYARQKKACDGCRGNDEFKSTACVNCKIKNCAKRADENMAFCFDCNEFPCARLSHLDKRYRTRYATSPLANLEHIKTNGLADFVLDEIQKWSCPACGAILCMHSPHCLSCGYAWHV